MAIPDFQTLMLPVLRIAATGEVRISDVVEKLADEFSLSAEDRSHLLPSGKQTTFANRVHWAKSYLGKADLVELTKGASEWPALSAKIGKQKFVRNMAAHASLGFNLKKEEKRWRVMLTNQELDKKHKRTELEVTGMKAAAEELDELRRVMQKFLIRALRHVGPQAQG